METGFEKLLTDEEAAELLQVAPRILQRMARKGEIPALKVGKFWRFRSSELDKWIGSLLASPRQVCRAF